MKKILLFSYSLILLFSFGAHSAVKKSTGAKGAAMVATTAKSTVRAKVSSGIEETECYQTYFGCMDNFCQSANESGGSCMCSADYAQYEATMKKIEKNTDEASRIATIEVEKARAGANADILFNGTREYDKDGNVVNDYNAKAKKKAARQAELDRLFGTEEFEEEEDEAASLDGLSGKALYDGARNLCLETIPEECETEMKLISP
ncbi:MAG: hypothetical protein LBL46_05190 [Rickettsiales bacterium]|jgi:hypothetical protein|nr:hypothetical protein [Rickettsiales bacterium]